MSDDPTTPEPEIPEARAASEAPKRKKPRGLEAMRTALELPPQEQASATDDVGELAEERAMLRPPFNVNTRLRYRGSTLLLAGWEGQQALVPGTVVVITENVGPYSCFELQVAKLRVAIAEADAADWILVVER
jgi:hypothetical protein